MVHRLSLALDELFPDQDEAQPIDNWETYFFAHLAWNLTFPGMMLITAQDALGAGLFRLR